MKSYFKWALQIAGAIVLATGGFLFLRSDWTRIHKIEIVQAADSSPLLFERIRNSLQPELNKKQGARVWDVSLRDIRKFVRRDRRVKEVSILREFPGSVRVVVEPYSPVLGFLDTDGKIYPIANDATLLPAVSAQENLDVPILRGPVLREKQELREVAIALLESLPPEGSLSKRRISEVVYSKEDGFKVFLAGANTEVRFGDTDFSPKVSRVTRVLTYLENQNIKSRVIDARFSKKVVVRARNAP